MLAKISRYPSLLLPEFSGSAPNGDSPNYSCIVKKYIFSIVSGTEFKDLVTDWGGDESKSVLSSAFKCQRAKRVEKSEYTNPGLISVFLENLSFTHITPSSHQLTPYPPYPPQIAHPTLETLTPGAPADTQKSIQSPTVCT